MKLSKPAIFMQEEHPRAGMIKKENRPMSPLQRVASYLDEYKIP